MLVKAGTNGGVAVYIETLSLRAIGPGVSGPEGAPVVTIIDVGPCGPGLAIFVDDAPEDVAALVELGRRVDMLSDARIPGLSESAQAEVDRALGIKRRP